MGKELEMKSLLYLVMSLVVIAAIIPAASADFFIPSTGRDNGNWSYFPTVFVPAGTSVVGPNTSQATQFCIYSGLSSATGEVSYRSWTDETHKYYSGVTWAPATTSAAYNVTTQEFICNDGHWHLGLIIVTGGSPTIETNFTGTPTSGSGPLNVALTDTSLNATYSPIYNWTIAPATGWYLTSGTINSKDIAAAFVTNGNYTITHGVSTPFSSDIETKTDYIWVYNSTATKTKYFQTIDGTNGNIVLNSSIQLNDIENSSWVNATGLINDGTSSITTIQGHHINAYAQALGYSDSDSLNRLNDGTPEYIMMWPTFAQNVSTGNVSLYVTVKDKDTKANIVGAGVTASLSTGSSQSTTTNEAGIAYFVVTNNTMALITAQAIGQGYQTATTTINTGTGSGGSASAAATILLGKNTVTPVFSTVVTTLPGGGTPTPTVTILPGCEDTISAEGQAKCRAAQSNQGLSYLSANMMDIIQICVFVTILYLLGIKLGK